MPTKSFFSLISWSHFSGSVMYRLSSVVMVTGSLAFVIINDAAVVAVVLKRNYKGDLFYSICQRWLLTNLGSDSLLVEFPSNTFYSTCT
mmetsp:Transcript_19116/g.33682  ORF Transcript_19116/g.33682 Transcript_19116/m.33682 type:complete len:89 (+) Transcript_19116:1709-1975(+)